MKPLLLSLTFFVALTGCAPLIIRDDDNAAIVAVKVITRAIGCLPTLCMTEAAMADAKRHEAFQQWYRTLTPDQQAEYLMQKRKGNTQVDVS